METNRLAMGPQNTQKIAVFLSFSWTGGVERMLFKLCEAFADNGYPVDLLLIKTLDSKSPMLPTNVNIIHLNAASTLASLPALIHYIKTRRPAVLLAAKDRANRAAVLAKMLSTVPFRLILRMGTHTSTFLAEKSLMARYARFLPMKWLYPKADGIVAISTGVAADLAKITGINVSDIHIIPNPTVSPEIHGLAEHPVDHPWLAEKTLPVIMGAGRLTRQKDFGTLIRAFALLRKRMPVRLIILGEGNRRKDLTALAAELGVSGDIDLVGFVRNPYAYMKKADLFVLSSIWEGLGNVLIEALALGVPVVSTDCPSGPREILNNGAFGFLVPVGDAAEMAGAMSQTLRSPLSAADLATAASPYHLDKSASAYLKLLIGAPAA